MHILNKLKIISLVTFCLMVNALILDGFLFNYFNLNYFKNFKIAEGFLWKYRWQEIISLGAIFSGFYLTVTIFMTEFLIINSHSKYSDHCDIDEDEPHLIEKIFLSIIPILCFCIIFLFLIQLMFFSSHYVTGKDLYHKTPVEFIKMKKENRDKAITVLLSSIKDKVKSKIFGGDVIKHYRDLPWDLLEFDSMKYFFFKMKFLKLLTTGFISCILLVCMFVRFNVLGVI